MPPIRPIALCLSMFVCCASLAATPGTAMVAPQDLILAIRAQNDEATKAAAARLQAAAEAGDSFAMYDVGSLHRQSGRKGAAVFAYDPGKALKWLTRAFDSGRLTAAYKIALTYAAIGDDMEAMGWAQVYSHFMRPIEQRQDRQSQLRLALLNDLYARVGHDREDAIEERLMTLLDKHGPSFEAARDRARGAIRTGSRTRTNARSPSRRKAPRRRCASPATVSSNTWSRSMPAADRPSLRRWTRPRSRCSNATCARWSGASTARRRGARGTYSRTSS